MRAHPILFSAPMAKAILASKKTVTRRLVRLPVAPGDLGTWEPTTIGGDGVFRVVKGERVPVPESPAIWHTRTGHIEAAPWGVGDHLWIKETWQTVESLDDVRPSMLAPTVPVRYLADGSQSRRSHEAWGKTRVSIFMPRWASRISLTVESVRVERLHDISGEDAIAEGIAPLSHRCGCEVCGMTSQLCPASASSLILEFAELWRGINGAQSWDANPWVWVVEFKLVEQATRQEAA